MKHATTPDGRYFVVTGGETGRLWRSSDPSLTDDARQAQVDRLMRARRAVRAALDGHTDADLRRARSEVDAAKRALGERGPVWWTDGAPDYNRHLAIDTPYRGWFEALDAPTGSVT